MLNNILYLLLGSILGLSGIILYLLYFIYKYGNSNYKCQHSMLVSKICDCGLITGKCHKCKKELIKYGKKGEIVEIKQEEL